MYNLNTPEFKQVNKSQYARGTDFQQDNVEYIGNNYYTPTSVNCFIKCMNYFIRKDYPDEFSAFIRTEQKRSNFMTSSRIQPFFRKHNINIGYYDGFGVCPRKITEKNTALKILNNHFCLIWKSDGFSFDKAIKVLKDNFKIVDNDISNNYVKSFIKYEYRPKKFQSQLTNMVVYDLETFNINEAVAYVSCIYRLSKISGKYNRDITQRECEKCRKDYIDFKGTYSINEMLDYVLQFKREAKMLIIKLLNIIYTYLLIKDQELIVMLF